MNTKKLSVIANGHKLGEVSSRANRLSFHYAPEWQNWAEAFPLSVSMPLPLREHGHAVVEAFLWGLLPDNAKVLESWGRRFQVSPRNVFSLLEHVGEDCAGAIQFIRPELEAAIIGENYQEQVEWITDDDLRERLEAVLRDHGLQRNSQDRGQFSLAGAQPKIALYQSPLDGTWGIPYGVTPTTHILKPAASDFDGFAENEHFCLMLAKQLGLRTAESSIIFADHLPTIVAKRYDRLFQNEKYLRIHQEDFCQATATPPDKKYQSDGGPGVAQIADLIRDVSENALEDIQTFAKSLIFNFLIAGTDAHAKNYSLLLATRSQIRLAPLYDLASSLPYPKVISPFKAKMALKIGSKYKFRDVQPSHWQACAKELGIRWPLFKELWDDLFEQAIQCTYTVADELRESGLRHPVINVLEKEILDRANKLSMMIS